MKVFARTIAVLMAIILVATLLEAAIGAGGIGLAAALGVAAGELGWARLVRPDDSSEPPGP